MIYIQALDGIGTFLAPHLKSLRLQCYHGCKQAWGANFSRCDWLAAQTRTCRPLSANMEVSIVTISMPSTSAFSHDSLAACFEMSTRAFCRANKSPVWL